MRRFCRLVGQIFSTKFNNLSRKMTPSLIITPSIMASIVYDDKFFGRAYAQEKDTLEDLLINKYNDDKAKTNIYMEKKKKYTYDFIEEYLSEFIEHVEKMDGYPPEIEKIINSAYKHHHSHKKSDNIYFVKNVSKLDWNIYLKKIDSTFDAELNINDGWHFKTVNDGKLKGCYVFICTYYKDGVDKCMCLAISFSKKNIIGNHITTGYRYVYYPSKDFLILLENYALLD